MQRPAPNPKVLGWLDTGDEDHAFISVASIAELRRGIALMGDSRLAVLTAWLANDPPTRFAGRILPIDYAIAEHWSELMVQSRRSGVALSAMDGFFAASALAKNLDEGHAQPQGFRFIRRRAVQSHGDE